MLLGLPLVGEPIGPLQQPADWEQYMAQRFEGIRPDIPMSFASEKHSPTLAWLLNF
jgi:hypothetical protein